jgi:hypothetical protein
MPAKKKGAKKPTPPVVPVPPPVLTPPQKRLWKVVQTKNLIGGIMFLVGVAFALGYIASDKAHLHEKVALYAAGVFMLFGAHFLSSAPTEAALKSISGAVKGVLPKRDDPPAGGGA